MKQKIFWLAGLFVTLALFLNVPLVLAHEVQPVDTLAFPILDSTQSEAATFGTIEWLAIAGFMSSLLGLILSIVNLRRNRV